MQMCSLVVLNVCVCRLFLCGLCVWPVCPRVSDCACVCMFLFCSVLKSLNPCREEIGIIDVLSKRNYCHCVIYYELLFCLLLNQKSCKALINSFY